MHRLTVMYASIILSICRTMDAFRAPWFLNASDHGPAGKWDQNIRRVALPLKKRRLTHVLKDGSSNFCSKHQAGGI
jgi:hypothetical protein